MSRFAAEWAALAEADRERGAAALREGRVPMWRPAQPELDAQIKAHLEAPFRSRKSRRRR